jgi:NTE family protein/lysophospholipid hydrolase
MTAPSLPPPADARAFLRSTELFGRLTDDALDEVVEALEWVHVAGGETLFRQGDRGDALYIVVSGRLRVHLVRDDGSEIAIREVGRGENVGELSVLTAEPRSATVRAVRDTDLARLTRARFDRLLTQHPQAMVQLIRMLATWVRRSNLPAPKGCIVTIAVVPLEPGAPVRSFVAQLAQALGRYGDALLIDRETVDRALFAGAAELPEHDPRNALVTGWLDERESLARFVVYCGAADGPAWSRRCLRQADRALLLARASAWPSDTAPIVDAVLASPDRGEAREDLVLLHDHDGGSPRATAEWLGLRPFAAHHHLRSGSRRDFDRLARRLEGKAVGLVLSGGGARGFAHIGVIQALEEAGIPIDRLGGTSMGAVIAAQYASGIDPRAMVELNRLWQERNPLWDLTLPMVALVSGRTGMRILDRMFGDRRIEDLWLEFFCCSTNLTRSELHVHRAGPLSRAVRASISIPGIAPPLRIENGDLLVDGGVLNNLPADVMRMLGNGRTIAVDVASPSALTIDPDYGDMPSPWQMLRDYLNPLGADRQRSATIFAILERTTLVASLSLSQRLRHEVDLYLSPPVAGFGSFEWTALERIVAAGLDFARRQIAEWQERGGFEG